MAEVNVVKKALATMQDLSRGINTVDQVRGGSVYTLNNISLATVVDSEAKLAFLDPVQTHRAGVLRNGQLTEYVEVNGVWVKLIAANAEASYYNKLQSFALGNTLNSLTDVLWNDVDSQYYKWAGAFPKTVAAGSTPETSGGISPTTWVAMGSATLRSDLAKANGYTLVGGVASSADIATVQASLAIIVQKDDIYVDDYKASTETSYDNAVQEANAAAVAAKKPLRWLGGTYNMAAPVVIDMPSAAPAWLGNGISSTKITFPNAQAGEKQLIIQSASDWYDYVMQGMTISSAHAGTLLQIGRDNYNDPLNVARFQDLAVLNSFQGGNVTEAMRLNYLVNSNFIGVRANAYANGAGNNQGRALVVRQMSFSAFMSCSFGNASYGISFLDGFSFGNVWNALDCENVNIGIYNGSANAGRNTFIGGQYSLWQNYMVQAPVGSGTTNRIHIINGNFSQDTNQVDPANCVGVLIEGQPIGITTPGMPGSEVSLQNTTGRNVDIYFNGGTSFSGVAVEGVQLGARNYVNLKAGQHIQLTYAGAPTWLWLQAG
ncbi:hypothetical protein [Dickeya phage Amaethon]|nr:hypothetical protein [Dickeya phage Amaethon]